MENMLTGNLRKLAVDVKKLASYLTAVLLPNDNTVCDRQWRIVIAGLSSNHKI